MQTVTNKMISSSAPVMTECTALDFAGEQIQDGRIAFALDAFFEDLRARREEEPEVWPEYARACLSHPVPEFAAPGSLYVPCFLEASGVCRRCRHDGLHLRHG
jgi:hypothetical protein